MIEGDWIDDLPDGYVKYIDEEGEYFCYKRHGKGKEFDKKGRLIFKGWYMYGKYWSGKKKQYDKNGDLKFEV